MLSGVVNVRIWPDIAFGELELVGDGSNNQVEIRQTANPGEYHISSPDNTLFRLNDGLSTFAELPVNGISGDITVDLGDGNDTFSFLGVAAGGTSNVPDDLKIKNSDGSNVNIISDVLINGDLNVDKDAGSSGYSELQIINTTVIGETKVDNYGNGTGDTKTLIDNSKLQGGGFDAYGLFLKNPDGEDIFDAQGNSQFGTGSFVGNQPVIKILNNDGGSRTTFTGANQVAGPGTTTVYGRIEIYNDLNFLGTLDIVTFNSINVLGGVYVDNDYGSTETFVINSTLGSQFVAPPDGTGGSMRVSNDGGFDTFMMSDSLVPWGLKINNDDDNNGESTWGSSTQIEESTLVTHPPGSALFNDYAFQFYGDDGADVINLIETVLGGEFYAYLYDGNNNVSLLNSAMAGIYLVADDGNDTVSIDNTQIVATIYMFLDDGADLLSIHNMNYATQWPSPLLGSIEIDADEGVDTFSGAIPPNDVFEGFDFFIP